MLLNNTREGDPSMVDPLNLLLVYFRENQV
jgi:hypothetical protein